MMFFEGSKESYV